MHVPMHKPDLIVSHQQSAEHAVEETAAMKHQQVKCKGNVGSHCSVALAGCQAKCWHSATTGEGSGALNHATAVTGAGLHPPRHQA